MNFDPLVVRRQVEITNALGLHFRPAEKFVRTAEQFQSEIHVWYNGQSRDGRSILDLATLAAERGTRLELEAIGPDAEAAITALVDLIAAEFHEDEMGEPKPASSQNGSGCAGEPAGSETADLPGPDPISSVDPTTPSERPREPSP